MLISFDFDGVLTDRDYHPTDPYPDTVHDTLRRGMRELLHALWSEEHNLMICSARIELVGKEIEPTITRWGIKPWINISAYGVKKKAEMLKGLADIHIDDHPSIIREFYERDHPTLPIHFSPEGTSLFDVVARSPDDIYRLVRLHASGELPPYGLRDLY